jgi:aryl-alcohol dehydrogenase-like predicted oxidoreductase
MASTKKITIGGVEVGRIGYGAMLVASKTYDRHVGIFRGREKADAMYLSFARDEQVFQTLKTAIDGGSNFINSAGNCNP